MLYIIEAWQRSKQHLARPRTTAGALEGRAECGDAPLQASAARAPHLRRARSQNASARP